MSNNTFGFVLEQTLGHVTHSKNLLANVNKDSSVNVVVAPVEFEASGPTANLPIFNNWTVHAGMQARRAVRKMDQEQEIDALFVHTQVPAVLMTKWLKRIPTIVSLDATPLQYDQLGEFYAHKPGNSWAERLKWQANRNCFQLARRLVTWSQWAKDGLIDEYQIDPGKITVIPPGVNLADWPEQEQEPTAMDPLKILFVGGDLQRKGGHDLIEAFRAIRLMNQNTGSSREIELHMVTHAAIDSEPGLHVYNNVKPNSDTLKNLFQQSQIFCLPTYGDCLPMVLSEAGAVGLPSISTQVAAIPEIIKDGQSGLLVPPGNREALTEALRTLIDNPDLRKKMGKSATALVRKNYDGQKNANRLIEELKALSNGVHYRKPTPLAALSGSHSS